MHRRCLQHCLSVVTHLENRQQESCVLCYLRTYGVYGSAYRPRQNYYMNISWEKYVDDRVPIGTFCAQLFLGFFSEEREYDDSHAHLQHPVHPRRRVNCHQLARVIIFAEKFRLPSNVPSFDQIIRSHLSPPNSSIHRRNLTLSSQETSSWRKKGHTPLHRNFERRLQGYIRNHASLSAFFHPLPNQQTFFRSRVSQDARHDLQDVIIVH